MCYNAISILLDVPKKIKGFHQVIDLVFLEVGPLLAQFKIYERTDTANGIDHDMKFAINKVLICFINICAACISIERGSKFERFKAHAKRVLLDDKMLESEIADLKTLVQRQQTIQNAVTLEVLMKNNVTLDQVLLHTDQIQRQGVKIEGNLQALVDSDEKRRSDDEREKVLKSLRTWLGLDDSDASSDAYNDMKKTMVPNTGQWLRQHELYKKWVDNRSVGVDPLLLLTGGDSTGKTYSLASVFSHLKCEQLPQQDGRRSLVAYYVFSPATGKKQNEAAVETALKHICIQLAEQDQGYANIIEDMASDSKKDQNNPQLARYEQLWSMLKIGAPMKMTTHFVLVDVGDDLPEHEKAKLVHIFGGLCTGLQSEPLRLLACGRPEVFTAISTSKAVSKINIEKHNMGDMRLYIQSILKEEDLFPYQNPEHLKKRTEIETALLQETTAPTFKHVQAVLVKIRRLVVSGDSDEQFKKLLQNPDANLDNVWDEEIGRLESELNEHLIDLLNEILIWVCYGARELTVKELESALVSSGSTT
jgi:hypothetical protein